MTSFLSTVSSALPSQHFEAGVEIHAQKMHISGLKEKHTHF